MNIDKRYEQGESNHCGTLRYGIIEVTTKCQNRCSGCYMVRRNTLNTGEMSIRQATDILDLCRNYCGKELETMDILGGEPLLWPPLKEYLEELISRGIKPWIFTNMLSIDETLARWLFEKRIYITGKLNIADFGDNIQLRLQAKMIGNSLDAAKEMKAKIELLLKVGYKYPLLRLQNLLRKANIALVPDYYKFCLEKEIGTDLEMMGFGENIGAEYLKVAPAKQQIATMIKRVQAVRREFGLPPAEVLMPHIFGSCPFYDRGLYFAVDGHIRACSNSAVKLSDTEDDEPVKKAYTSELICNRLSLTQEKVGEPCHSCKKWARCRGGCRATVEGAGNPFGGYSLCPTI